MSAEDNATLLRHLFGAFYEGDMETIKGGFAEDAVWHMPGKSQLAGDHQGPDAIVGFIERSVELAEGTFQLELLDVMASEDHGVSWQRITAERGDKTLDQNEALVFRIRDGKIAEVWHRPEQYALDEFYSS